MAVSNSLSSISKLLNRNLLSTYKPSFSQFPKCFFSAGPDFNPDFDDSKSDFESVTEPFTESLHESSSSEPARQRVVKDVVLEGGLDVGVYKAIIVGRIGQSPLQKRLKSGRALTMTTVGTGGIRNERIPFPNEEPREYADRCNVQWHRVAVYHEKLADVVMKHAQPGTIVYVEGNLETKIFTDQITGLVRRIREIAVRQTGRLVFLGNDKDFSQPSPMELRGIGYY